MGSHAAPSRLQADPDAVLASIQDALDQSLVGVEGYSFPSSDKADVAAAAAVQLQLFRKVNATVEADCMAVVAAAERAPRDEIRIDMPVRSAEYVAVLTGVADAVRWLDRPENVSPGDVAITLRWRMGDVCFFTDTVAGIRNLVAAIREHLARDVAAANEGDVPQYATLDQMAALLHKGKRTLERWKTDGKLPPPDVEGGGGKADEWIWGNIRPKLETLTKRQLPKRFPSLS